MPEVVELPEKNISQAYGIMTLDSRHRLVRRLRQSFTPSVHGHKTWSSSYLLMDYFLHHALLKKNLELLEIGCGWGPASIFCAKRGCRVTGLDMDEDVFPFLEVQAALNDVQVRNMTGTFEGLSKRKLSRFQMVIGADVCFWDELTDIHFGLVQRSLAAGVKHIIYADPGRSPFFDLADQCSEHFKAEQLEWYSSEPERFEGYILHIRR